MLSPKNASGLPFLITIAGILLLDQATKILVVAHIPQSIYAPVHVAWSWGGDFLQIIHVRNPGVLFSIGSSLSSTARTVLFSIIPLVTLIFLIALIAAPERLAKINWLKLTSDPLTVLQRWALTLAVGGGLGNIVDRIFRPAGVVDFIDIKFYGLLGMERWPTFNVADMAVVMATCLLISELFFIKKGVRDVSKKA